MYYNAHHSRDWALRFCTENEEAPAVFMPLSFREEPFSETHIHTPAYLYGSGVYILRVSALSRHSA